MNALTMAEWAMSNRFPDFFSNTQKDIDLAMGFQRLAEDFYLGRGREPDLEQAKLCLRKAIQYGVGDIRAEALCSLALLVEDPQIKLLLYMEAVDENSAYAMNMVGVCIERYGVGEGHAVDWYKRAAQAGSPQGKHNLEQWNKRLAAELETQAEIKEKKSQLQSFFNNNLWYPSEIWRDEPAAILYVPDISDYYAYDRCYRGHAEMFSDEFPGFSNALKELTRHTAIMLGQSVLLLADFDDMLIAVGYDYGKVGLLRAMNVDPPARLCYRTEDSFAITSVYIEDLSHYCSVVKERLRERNL